MKACSMLCRVFSFEQLISYFREIINRSLHLDTDRRSFIPHSMNSEVMFHCSAHIVLRALHHVFLCARDWCLIECRNKLVAIVPTQLLSSLQHEDCPAVFQC